jgi:hypothetical protein
MATSPTSRTLKYLRDKEYKSQIVEYWNSFCHQRRDLFHIIDIISITPEGIMGVQSCGQTFSEHKKKMLEEPVTKEWLEVGGLLMLIGWRKLKVKRGGKQMKWVPRVATFHIINNELITKEIKNDTPET